MAKEFADESLGDVQSRQEHEKVLRLLFTLERRSMLQTYQIYTSTLESEVPNSIVEHSPSVSNGFLVTYSTYLVRPLGMAPLAYHWPRGSVGNFPAGSVEPMISKLG